MKSQCLELAYQEALQNTELIVKDEASRRLRLQILLLENEADELHLQLATGDDRIDGLEEENEDLRAQLDQAQEDIKKVETDLRLQTRELNNIKVLRIPRVYPIVILIHGCTDGAGIYEWIDDGLDKGSDRKTGTQPRVIYTQTRVGAFTFSSGTSAIDPSREVGTSAAS